MKKLRRVNLKRTSKNKINMMLYLLVCIFILSLTVGYAAINQDLKISGEATFRVEEDIRITNVELSETTNMGIENYTSKYGKDSITLGVDLKEINSTVTYNVQIINSGTTSMWIDSITQEINNNTNMEYVLEGIGIKELINPGETKDFKLTIKYKEGITLPGDTNLDTMLRFNFVKPVSILAQGNGGAGTTTFYNGPITKESVESIEFLPTLEVGEGAIGSWDASYNKDGTVIAWYTDSDNNDLYELYIGGIGEVEANANSAYLFINFNKVTNIDFSSYFNTSKVTSMTRMFSYCESLLSVDVSGFDTSNVTQMNNMFTRCSSLKNLDVSNFNTEKVTNMGGMFGDCSSLESIDASDFNTSNVTTFGGGDYGMFSGCRSLTNIDVSGFDTPELTDVSYMFDGCTSLNIIGLNKMKFDNVTEYENMFYNTPKLQTVVVGNDYVTRMEEIIEQSGSSAQVNSIS